MSANLKNFIILNQIFDAYLKNKIREYVVEEFTLKFYEIP